MVGVFVDLLHPIYSGYICGSAISLISLVRLEEGPTSENRARKDLPMSNVGLDIESKRGGYRRYILPYQFLEDGRLSSIIESTVDFSHVHLKRRSREEILRLEHN